MCYDIPEGLPLPAIFHTKCTGLSTKRYLCIDLLNGLFGIGMCRVDLFYF